MAWPPVSLIADKELARYVIDEGAQRLDLGLDGQAALQSRDGLRALARALYEALADSRIHYALERFEADARVQHVRPPEAILGGAREGTCLDLALLYAGLALGKGLVPLVIVLEGHALVAVSLDHTRHTASDMGRGQEGDWAEEGLLKDDGSTLRGLVDAGHYLAIECTGFASSNAMPVGVPEGAGRIDGRLDFDAAIAAGRAQLDFPPRPFRFAIDVAVLRDHHGVFAHEAPLAGVTTPYRHKLDRLMAKETLFGGRDDELAWLDAAIAAGAPGHAFVIGDSGSGKTAMLVNWVRRLLERPAAKPGEPALRLAYVFINRDAELAEQPAVLNLLGAQLLRAHGLVETLPADVPTLEQRCVELLQTSPPAGCHIVVVIDGLDEAEAQGWNPKFLLPRDPAARTHLVFSARTVADRDWVDWLDLAGADVRVRTLHTLTASGVAALLRQAPAPLVTMAGNAAFVDALHEVSDGDPMYLKLLVEDLVAAAAKGHPPTVDAVSLKPRGLDNYLKVWWTELSAQRQAEPAVRDLLGYLLIARGALPRDVLIDIDEHDHLDSSAVDDSIRRIRRYVVGDEREGFRLGHPRLRRYLVGDRMRPSELRGVADALARWCEATWPDRQKPYAARHVIGQLREQRDRQEPSQRPAITARMLALLRDPVFRQRRIDDPEGLLHDESDFADVLAAALDDPLPAHLPSLANAVLTTAGLKHTLGERVERIFDRASRGEAESAAKLLPPLAPDARWLAAMLLVCCGLAALRDREKAAKFRRACAEAIRVETFDATLQLLDQRVEALLINAPPSVDPWPLPYAPGQLPVGSIDGEIARAIVTRMGGGGDAELIESRLDPSMIGTLENTGRHDDGTPVYLAERDSPWLVAHALRAAACHDNVGSAEAERLLCNYIAAHAANPYREYRQRSLWAVLGAVLSHSDAVFAMVNARVACEAAARAVTVDYREMLRLAGLGLAAQSGDTAAIAVLGRCITEAHEAASRLNPVRTEADTWGAHARRLAALAEVEFVARGDAPAAAALLDHAHRLPFGYAGFQAGASLTLADAEFVCRPDAGMGIAHALDDARRAAHNVQQSTFCALTTARVHTIATRWCPGAVGDPAGVVERFTRDPVATEFAPRHRVGESFDERANGPNMLPIPSPLRKARTLDAIARDVFAVPPDRLARLNGGVGAHEVLDEVAIPDPGFVPLLAARLSAELLGRRGELGAQTSTLIARLVPAAAADATALDAVMARLALALAPTDLAQVQDLVAIAPQDWMRSPIPNRNVEA